MTRLRGLRLSQVKYSIVSEYGHSNTHDPIEGIETHWDVAGFEVDSYSNTHDPIEGIETLWAGIFLVELFPHSNTHDPIEGIETIRTASEAPTIDTPPFKYP